MRNAREGVRLASLAGPLGSLLRSIALGAAAGALISRVISLPARPFGWALRRLPSAAGPRVKACPVYVLQQTDYFIKHQARLAAS